jgi:hypothetical protein
MPVYYKTSGVKYIPHCTSSSQNFSVLGLFINLQKIYGAAHMVKLSYSIFKNSKKIWLLKQEMS